MLVVEILEVPGGRAELSVLREPEEDLEAARDSGRWRVVEEPCRLEFPRLKPGVYRAEINEWQYPDPFGDRPAVQPSPRSRIRVELSAGETRTVTLPNFAAEEVTVTGILSCAGSALENHRVTLWMRESALASEAITDEQGGYRLQTLAGGLGEWEIFGSRVGSTTSKTRGVVDIAAGPNFRHDIDLSGGVLEGRVVREVGSPNTLPPGKVRVDSMEPSRRDDRTFRSTLVEWDTNGFYRLIGLAPGTYRVSAVGPNPFVATAAAGDVTEGNCLVEVGFGLARAPEIVVKDAIALTGRVVFASETGYAVYPRTTVFARLDDRAGAWRAVARSGPDGSWTTYMAPGVYLFRAQGSDPIPTGMRTALRAEVSLTSGELSIDTVHADSHARVRVVDGGSGRYLRFCLELLDGEDLSLPERGTWSLWNQEQATGSLPPGKYSARILAEDGTKFTKEFDVGSGQILELEFIRP